MAELAGVRLYQFNLIEELTLEAFGFDLSITQVRFKARLNQINREIEK